MCYKVRLITLFISLFIISNIQAQGSKKEEALKLGVQAIKLIDEGKTAESITLLEEAQKLDPDNINYPYEIAYAKYIDKDYAAAGKILEKLSKHKDVSDNIFQLLGNSYSMQKQPEKALEAYDRGLKVFPKSGKLFLEKGNIYWMKDDFLKALEFYEDGIEADPKFPSNYYRATRIYCSSSEKMWGLIYGEIFMNMERSTSRTAEISELLYETYVGAIDVSSDTSSSIHFCRVIITAPEKGKFKMPFCMTYEQSMILAIIGEKEINLSALNNIRTRFIEFYFNEKKDKEYPNILFSFNKKIMDAGHFDAYNNWLLMKGDEESSIKWAESHPGKWESFIKWFTDNRLVIDEKNYFHSEQ